MKNKLLLVLLAFISACTFIESPSTVTPSAFASLATATSPPRPIITPSLAITSTPTFSPYTHEPFSIVFLREGNLWIAVISERTIERQLTFESPEMRVVHYAISPDETRIAYIPYQVETFNSLIKLVDIATGEIEVILGENDPYNEINVFWVDNAKIAYVNQGLVPAFVTEKTKEITTYIIYDLISKKQVSTTEYKSISQSPNGRYWLTCSGFIVCKYTLHDLLTGKQSDIESNINFGWFINWSPDSELMLFTIRDSESDDCTNQLIIIDTETLQEKLITPEDKNVWDASVSPSGELLAYQQNDISDFNMCKVESYNYWLMDLDTHESHAIFTIFKKSIWDINWTPDGKRLIFFYDTYGGREGKTLWSMNLDGSDLKPMLANVKEYRIISSKP